MLFFCVALFGEVTAEAFDGIARALQLVRHHQEVRAFQAGQRFIELFQLVADVHEDGSLNCLYAATYPTTVIWGAIVQIPNNVFVSCHGDKNFEI